ncbi:MAG: histidine phosphatase family protein [Victivallaceae bacterium]|nr:histidine phosphatase family protein [Victivallaceae bacterium]
MKIVIMRHAEAKNHSATGGDFGRELSTTGRETAHEVGRFLACGDFHFGRIFASGALRARETAGIVAEEIGYPKEAIGLCRSFYDIDAAELIDFILESSEDSPGDLLIVGHNPAVSEAATLLTHQNHILKPAQFAVIES